MDPEQREYLASVFKGVAHPTRLAVLEAVSEGASIGEMASSLDVARGTVQSHLETLVEAELVYRPSEGRGYAVTPLGDHILGLVCREADVVVPVLEDLDAAEDVVRDEIGPALELVDEIDEATWERTVHTRKWEEIWDDAEDHL